ncbi:MAG: YihY/virulence factor BrkB family protein [Sphaerochaetaceae bacterium]|nr:YihY/virulence factor BrkB family protein [Sphaerochaetaceae bacterium]
MQDNKIRLKEQTTEKVEDFFALIWRSYQSVSSNGVTILASGLVYSSLIAIVPSLTFLFTFFSFFGVMSSFAQFFDQFLIEILGEEIGQTVFDMITQYTNNAMGLGIMGLISFVISATLLIGKVYNVINTIFFCKGETGSVKRYGSFFLFLLFTALLFTVSLTLMSYAEQILASVSGEFLDISLPKIIWEKLGVYLLLLAGLFCLYYYVPEVKVRFKSAFIGASVGTIGLFVATYFFKKIVVGLVSYSVIYGSFAVIFFVFIYLYVSWYVVLISAEITYVHQFRPDGGQILGLSASPEQQISSCIELLLLIADGFREGKGPISQKQIIKNIPLSPKELYTYLGLFIKKGYLIETYKNGKNRTSYMIARPLSSILVRDIIELAFNQEYEAKDNRGEKICKDMLSDSLIRYEDMTLEELLEEKKNAN